ncbi:hypothetical protein ACFP63_08890 [Oerskovia jenensis]|uniref:DUF4190 domain-containing protein n=1 Tax=Oerskovia jenensis TaxID=162169 RepID=A0ABS2LIF4_9CELL|nr:hypothetical protein [Oerskovia jenensis]MBM7480170.1 hypothetical protein [Oerskovia jenensis]
MTLDLRGRGHVRIFVACTTGTTTRPIEVVVLVGLVIAILGILLLARVVTGVRRRATEQSTGAQGAGAALGGGLIFWGTLLVVVDVWNT